MTKTSPDDLDCRLEWRPGEGGLLACIDPTWVPKMAPPDHEAMAIRPADLHVTLLRGLSMAPLVDVLGPHWPSLAPTLPRPPRPVFLPTLHRATRGPHPRKDPPGETRSRSTWFLVLDDQDAWHRALRRIVTRLDAEAGARARMTFPHPEPDRLFHLSLFNDRGGDPARSIGDIGPADCIDSRPSNLL